MASNNLGDRVAALRQHLQRSIPDQTDQRVAEEHLLGVLEAAGAPDDADVGASDMALDQIFRRHPAPRVANSVR